MNADYNFWADLLDTYQSLTPWVQALWLIGPLAFLLALIKLPPRAAATAAASTTASTAAAENTSPSQMRHVPSPPPSPSPSSRSPSPLRFESGELIEELEALRLAHQPRRD